MRAPGPAAALAFALALAGWLGPTPALGATFVLDDGRTIVGTIVQATRNTLTIRPAIGGLRQVPVGRLERVEVTTADGQTLLGRYRGWADGRSLIEVGADLVSLDDDRVVERRPVTTRVLAAAPPPEGPARAASTTLPAARLAAPDPPAMAGGAAARAPVAAAAAAAPRPTVSAVLAPLPPAPPPQLRPAPAPAAGPALAALPAGDLPVLSVKTSPAEVTEKSGTLELTFELSRPLDDLLVVIYSTVDGAARSGADYEPLQGILTLPAGVTSSALRTAVLDDPEREGDEDFQLFLASNPDLATIAEQWTKITIRDDD